MPNEKIADVVVAIPYGDGYRKRYTTVGALIKLERNDESKGPGFIVMLDTTFNPAGAPSRDGSVSLSCYHPRTHAAPPAHKPNVPFRPAASFPDMEDDIPF